MINYKGYQLKNVAEETHILKDNDVVGCTMSDYNKNNSEAKAKLRIDTNCINMIAATSKQRADYLAASKNL